MCDFFELITGEKIDNLAVDQAISVQQLHQIEVLGKHYATDGWIRFASVLSPSLSAGRISSMYIINDISYMVVDEYPEVGGALTGSMLRLDANAKSRARRIIAFSDLLYLNGMWLYKSGDVHEFIEMNM